MNGTRSFIPPTHRTMALLLIVLMVGVGMLSAQTKSKAPAKKKTTTAAATKAAPTTDAGQKVYVDPVTHQIVQPDQSDIDALNAAGAPKTKSFRLAAAPVAAPQEFVTDNGLIGIAVPEDAVVYAVATKAPDGKVKMGCVDGKKKADAVVNSKTPQTEVLDVQ